MTNFIFKSQRTFKKISNLLEIILAEQRHQRQDNIQILFLLNKVLVNKNLQKQVDEYFDDTPLEEYKPEVTSPQTDTDEQ